MPTHKTVTALLILLLAILGSCNNQPQETDFFTDADKPDTVKPVITGDVNGMAYPQIFNAAFNEGTKVKQDNTTLSFYSHAIGNINIESGKIIACDPIVMHDAVPLGIKFPVGKFPVTLAMVKFNKDERVAFSRILFSTAPVVKWEFALHEGEKQISLKDTSFYCYGVDGGTGVFIDSIANAAFNEISEDKWEDVFIGKFEENDDQGLIYSFGKHSLATFSTGWGDGCYATYIGFDEKGNVCQLLTDFQFVEWWKLDEKQ